MSDCVAGPERQEHFGSESDAAEIGRGRVPVDGAAQPVAQPRAVGDVGLEVAPAAADQVVADVGRAIRRGPRDERLAGALHRAARDPHLRLAVGSASSSTACR